MRPAFSDAPIDCTKVANSLEQGWISPCMYTLWCDPAPPKFSFGTPISAVTWGWADQYLFTQLGSNFHMRWVIRVRPKTTDRATPAYCMNQTETWTLPETPAFLSNSRQEIWLSLGRTSSKYKPWWCCGRFGVRGDRLNSCELLTSMTFLAEKHFFSSFESVLLRHVKYFLQNVSEVHQTGQFLCNCWEMFSQPKQNYSEEAKGAAWDNSTLSFQWGVLRVKCALIPTPL